MQRTKVPLLPKHRLPAGARECRRERESLEDDAPTAADEAGAPTTAADHETAAAVEAIAMGDRRGTDGRLWQKMPELVGVSSTYARPILREHLDTNKVGMKWIHVF